MVGWVELEFDEVSHFSLSDVRLEGVTSLHLIFCQLFLENKMMCISRTFATATVRVIGSRVEVDAAELEEAGIEVTV